MGSFGAGDYQLEFSRQIGLDRSNDSRVVFTRPGEDEEIVSVTYEVQTTVSQSFVEIIQKDVRQNR